jgi:hypothetical protein
MYMLNDHLQGYHILYLGEGTWEIVIKNIHSKKEWFKKWYLKMRSILF